MRRVHAHAREVSVTRSLIRVSRRRNPIARRQRPGGRAHTPSAAPPAAFSPGVAATTLPDPDCPRVRVAIGVDQSTRHYETTIMKHNILDSESSTEDYPIYDTEWPWSSPDPEDNIPDARARRFTMTVCGLYRYADAHVEVAMDQALENAADLIYMKVRSSSEERLQMLKAKVLDDAPELVFALFRAYIDMRRSFLEATARLELPIEVDAEPGAETGEPPVWVLRRHAVAEHPTENNDDTSPSH